MKPTRTCSVDGCGRPFLAKGWCSAHYYRVRRTGTTHKEQASERILRRVVKQQRSNNPVYVASECWVYQGGIGSAGYGIAGDGGVSDLAHRVVYRAEVGTIPDGFDIDHLCWVKACVRPSHLEAVTRMENLHRRDRQYGIYSAATHCKSGHPFDEQSTYNFKNGRSRYCRECHRLTEAGRRARQKKERKHV